MVDYAKELRFYSDVHKIQESLAKIAKCLEKMSAPAITVPTVEIPTADYESVKKNVERNQGDALTVETPQG